MLIKIIDNFSYMLRAMTELSPYSAKETLQAPTFHYFRSGSSDSLLNGIFIHDAATPATRKALQDFLQRFSLNYPYNVWLAETTLTPELQQWLHGQGLKEASGLACLGGSLAELKHVPHASHLKTKKVSTPTDYAVYMNVLASGFGLTASVSHDFKTMLDDYRSLDARYNHYITYHQGNAASILSSLIYQGTLGIYCGTTLPAYQKMGIFTEVFRHCVAEGKKAGCTTWVYQSASSALINNITEKFGFRNYGKLLRYVSAAS